MPIRPKHKVPNFSLRRAFPDFDDCSLEPTLREWLVTQKDLNPDIALPDGSTITKYELVLEIEAFFVNLNICLGLKFNDGLNHNSFLHHFDNNCFERAYRLSRFPNSSAFKDFMYSVVLSRHFSLECQTRYRETGVLRYDLTEMESILIEVARINAECSTAVVNVMSEA
jgi:hypothetical protein